MNEKQENSLINMLNELYSLRKDFIQYKLETRKGLFNIQTSFFMTISVISVSLILYLLASQKIEINIFAIVSTITLSILFLSSSSWVRESVDNLAYDLENEEKIVLELIEKSSEKIIEAKNTDNFDLMISYIRSIPVKKESEPELRMNYSGEIFNFLLFFGLTNGLISTFIGFLHIRHSYLIVIILCFSFMFSFFPWSVFIMGKISVFCQFCKATLTNIFNLK